MSAWDAPPKDERTLHERAFKSYVPGREQTYFCSMPDMIGSKSRRLSTAKGYLNGAYDIQTMRPFVWWKKKGRRLYIRFCPAQFYEAKNPDPKVGGLSPAQKRVGKALQARGYHVGVFRSVDQFLGQVEHFEKNWHPMYEGPMVINLDSGGVRLPKRPADMPQLLNIPKAVKRRAVAARKKRATRKRVARSVPRRRLRAATGRKSVKRRRRVAGVRVGMRV